MSSTGAPSGRGRDGDPPGDPVRHPVLPSDPRRYVEPMTTITGQA